MSYSLNKLIYTVFRFTEHHASSCSLWLDQSSSFGLPASSNLLSLEIESSLFPAARKMLQVFQFNAPFTPKMLEASKASLIIANTPVMFFVVPLNAAATIHFCHNRRLFPI